LGIAIGSLGIDAQSAIERIGRGGAPPPMSRQSWPCKAAMQTMPAAFRSRLVQFEVDLLGQLGPDRLQHPPQGRRLPRHRPREPANAKAGGAED